MSERICVYTLLIVLGLAIYQIIKLCVECYDLKKVCFLYNLLFKKMISDHIGFFKNARKASRYLSSKESDRAFKSYEEFAQRCLNRETSLIGKEDEGELSYKEDQLLATIKKEIKEDILRMSEN